MIRMIGPKLVRLMFAAVLLACALQTPLLSDNPVGGQAEGDKQDVPAVSVLPSASLSPVTATAQEQSTEKSGDLLSVTPPATPPAPAATPSTVTPVSANQTPSIEEIKKQLSDLQIRFATINDQLKSNQTAAADAMGKLGELNKLLTQHQQQVAKAIEANKSSAADIVKIKSLEQENRELKAKLVDANAAIDSLAKLNRRYADQIATMEAGKKTSSPATTTEPAPVMPTPKANTKSDSDVKATPAIQDKPLAAALVPEKTADVAPEIPPAPVADKAPQAPAAKEITPTLSDEPMTVELAPAKNAAVKEAPKPAAPTKAKIEGTIMVVMGNTAAIDIGSNSGLTPGTVLDVVQDGKSVARMKIVSVGDGDAGGTIENPTTQVNPGATVVLR